MLEPTHIPNATDSRVQARVPDHCDRLLILERSIADAATVAAALRQDRVALLRNVAPGRADALLHEIAETLGLLESLRLQAGYASLLGHRRKIGEYRMTVNDRSDYQFIPPHSEGDSSINMQLASFYCFENSTDGGETLLMNVDDSSPVWNTLRENVTRIAPHSRSLSPAELNQARGLYRLRSADKVQPDDRLIRERPTAIPGLTLADVLAPVRKARSSILDRDLHAYWVSIAIMDHDALPFFVSILKQADLLREPVGGMDVRQMDNAATQRLWASGVDYNDLFRCKIRHKLVAGDLILFNNLTWTHSASNWTPGSGVRKVAAAFA
jgi:hypothetical protein